MINADKTQGENDMGQVDIIIGIKTGAMINYVFLTMSIMTNRWR